MRLLDFAPEIEYNHTTVKMPPAIEALKWRYATAVTTETIDTGETRPVLLE
jgi:hypothetical protein